MILIMAVSIKTGNYMDLILIVFAFVFFVLAALNIPDGRYNLIGAGLACWIATQLIGHFH